MSRFGMLGAFCHRHGAAAQAELLRKAGIQSGLYNKRLDPLGVLDDVQGDIG
jgi:hypothetical protein